VGTAGQGRVPPVSLLGQTHVRPTVWLLPAAWDDLDAERQGVMHTVSSIINVTNVGWLCCTGWWVRGEYEGNTWVIPSNVSSGPFRYRHPLPWIISQASSSFMDC
jgi:hypothetical protein